MRYFRAENANRAIAGVQFEIVYGLAGTAVGVYAAEEPKASEIAALMADPRNALTELTEAEYLAELQKKTFSSVGSSDSWKPQPHPAAQVSVALKGPPPAKPVDEEPVPVVKEVAEVVKVEELPPAPPELEEPPRRKRKK